MAAVAVMLAFAGGMSAVPAFASAASGGTGTLTGQVTQASDGAPVYVCANVLVYRGSTVVAHAMANDSTYQIAGLEPGSYSVLFTPNCTGPDLIGEWGDGTHGATQQTPTTIVAGSNMLNVALDPGAHITGTLTGSGAPINGIVTVVPLSPLLPGYAPRVGVSVGRIGSTPLPPGRYGLIFDGGPEWIAEDQNGVATTTPTSPPLVLGLSETTSVNIDLAPAGEISGTVRVVNADGTLSPMPDALVEYQNLDTPNEQSGLTRSGADGRYVIRGLNGRYQLEFEGPDESARILPEFLGGSRTADGAQIVEIRNNAVVGGKDVVLEVGGILEGWAKYVPTPGIGGSGYLNSFFTTFAFSRLDTSTGKYVRVDAPGPGEPINGDPYWGPLEPGTYRIVVDNVYWDGDPGAPGAKRYTFHGGVTGIVVGRDAVTDFGDLPLTTRYFDVSRASGADRFATSAAVSAATFAPGVPVAYLANGMTFPDALSGAAAAGAKNGPVLLTAASSIPAEISAELARLAPQRIVVLGGAGAVSDAVVAKAKTLTHGSVSRLSGADRYSTSAAISRATFATGVPVAYLANGMTFPDALSGAAAAAKLGGPVLLTATGALSAPVKAELSRLAPKKIVVLGGTGAVAEAVLRQARVYTHGTVTRASGADRYATSAALSAVTFASGVPVVYLADGLTFPDALSGAAAAGSRGGPVLLVEPGGIPEATADELIRLAPKKIVALGGTGALTDAVLDDARSVLSYVSAQTP
ncbi:cell wall-binding repeat-containing protein [Microbacterium sp.]|uniref:cell wall-binding repeat-containing protein n=2 Tax=Microbacterium sp. TaxID=51671 RepID=UPI000926D4AB|nr:cell wall-binding repeat-containing protein [Microbacterium sp.]MBN9187350.1 cell wall-binding repeat-containing protein [Microbacterium sp.]MBN9192047.1 cell wall-binding repeat-containing protein [Microbacterium sp.]OJU57928.1 MAG: hypothetical protein BGO04_10935 [Microbacterium sp. 70-38]